MFGIFLGIILGILVITWFYYWKPYSYWKAKGVPQANPIIFFGSAFSLLTGRKDLLKWMDGIYYMYSNARYTGFYQFYQRTLMVKDPDLIKQTSIKDFDHFMDHSTLSISEDVDPLWGKNLFSLKGQKWRDMRATMSASFTSGKMKIMYALIDESSKNFVTYFLKKNEDFIDVEMKGAFSRFTNDVIASTSFGIKVDSMADPNNEFYQMGKEATNFNFMKFIGFFLCPKLLAVLGISFFTKSVSNFFTKLIYETIKVREDTGIVRPDLINILLEIKKGNAKQDLEDSDLDNRFTLSEESYSDSANVLSKRQLKITNLDIAAQAMVFFIAGFESVSSAMCYLCHELAVNPEVQEKLRAEIRDTYEKCNENLTYDALLKMKYMDMVVLESLRKWPPSPAIDRLCVKPYKLQPSNPDEPTINIKTGDVIWIPTSSLQNDPKYFPDPKKFNPERFSEENRKHIDHYTYIPFGLGPRQCIGNRFALLEIKSVIFYLLDNFEIVTTEKTQIPLKIDPKSVTIQPIGGFPLGLKRIEK